MRDEGVHAVAGYEDGVVVVGLVVECESVLNGGGAGGYVGSVIDGQRAATGVGGSEEAYGYRLNGDASVHAVKELLYTRFNLSISTFDRSMLATACCMPVVISGEEFGFMINSLIVWLDKGMVMLHDYSILHVFRMISMLLSPPMLNILVGSTLVSR